MGGMERASYGRDGEVIIWEGWRGHHKGVMERASYGRDGEDFIWEGWRGGGVTIWEGWRGHHMGGMERGWGDHMGGFSAPQKLVDFHRFETTSVNSSLLS